MAVSPSSSNLSAATTRHTDAASFWLLALPAVTVPSGMMDLSRPSASVEVSALGPSSVSKFTGSPRR